MPLGSFEIENKNPTQRKGTPLSLDPIPALLHNCAPASHIPFYTPYSHTPPP